MDKKPIRLTTFRGLKWTTLSQYGQQIGRLLTTLILARILAPKDFGLVSMARVTIGFIILFRDLGTSQAIIQRPNLTKNLFSSIFWVNTCFGATATGILFFASPYVAMFFREPKVEPVMMVFSFTFIITGITPAQLAHMQRNLEFKKIAIIELISVFLGSASGISMALLGFGVWSLVGQAMIIAIVSTILLFILCDWKPEFKFYWNEVKSVFSYSMNLTGFTIFNYFARNADNLIIGRYLGSTPLGYYNLAYQIMLYPLDSITSVISRVMFPIYSKIQDDLERFREVFLKMEGSIAFITFPLMIGLISLVEPFVTIMFGQKWIPAVPILIILAPVGMFQSILSPMGIIYQAKGRTDWMFRWGIVSSTLAVCAFVLGVKYGIQGVAIGYAIYTFLTAYPTIAIPFKLIKLKTIKLFEVIVKPLLISLFMLTSIKTVQYVLKIEIMDNSIIFGSMIIFGVIIYMIASMWINRKQILFLLNTARGK